MDCYTSFGQALRAKLLELGLTNRQNPMGCTDEEIQSFMRDQEVSFLPSIYLEFLMHTGKNGGSWYAGTDFFCSDLIGLKRAAIYLLLENEVNFQLPNNSFVFLMHQGYVFMYFICKERENDPEVYYYLEGDEHPSLKWNTLSQMLAMFILEEQGEEAYQTFLSTYAPTS